MLRSKTSSENLDASGLLSGYVYDHYSGISLLTTSIHRFVLLLILTNMRNQTRKRKSIEVMRSWSMSERRT